LIEVFPGSGEEQLRANLQSLDNAALLTSLVLVKEAAADRNFGI
jgi:hypothetical protein